jgi:O-antigen ligase
MTRVLLFLLFFVLLAADTLGWNLSLAPGLSVKNAMLYLILGSIALETALKRNRSLELLSVTVPYMACLFYAFLTWLAIVLLIEYPGYSAKQGFIYLKAGLADNLIVFLVFFYGVLTSSDAKRLLKMMIWTVIATNVVAVIDGLNMPNLDLIHEREDGRIGGPIGESNQYAAYLALFLPAALALVLMERGMKRTLAVLGLGASALAFLMTVSRGGFVGLAAGTVLGAFFLREYVSGKAVMSAITGVVILSLVSFVVLYFSGYTELIYDRVVAKTTGGSAQTITSGRTWIWSEYLGKMLESPITLVTGFGWNSYRYFPDFLRAPHNGYLGIFFQLGIIGLTLVLMSFANILRAAREGLQHAEDDREATTTLFAFVVGLLSVLIAIMFVDLTTPWIFIWAYAGVVMRIAVLQRQVEPASALERPAPGLGSRADVPRTA